MPIGLFTRDELKKGNNVKTVSNKVAAKTVSPEQLHKLGLTGLNMNPDAKHPNMPPSGPDNPLVYVIGEAGGEQEDLKGEPFIGKAGQTLRTAIPRRLLNQTRFDNVVRTRPPNNRLPSYVEIERHRPTIEASIEAAAPPVILAVGMTPIKWFLGENPGKIVTLRGRRFPVKIRSHSCWLYATYHPSYVNRIENSRVGKLAGSDIKDIFEFDIANCFADAEAGVDVPTIIEDVKPYADTLELLYSGSADKVIEWLDYFDSLGTICGIDLETNCLRPYKTGSKILSCSVANAEGGVAFALDHPQARWAAGQRDRIIKRLREFIQSPTPKVAHNLGFEMEWFTYLYGLPILNEGRWHCSMAQAYVLDEREGGKSLDFLCNLRFGINLKQHSSSTVTTSWLGTTIESESVIDRAKLEHTPVEQVLRYNGLDSIFEVMLYAVQKIDIVREGLWPVYIEQVRRVATAVAAQFKGFEVSQPEVEILQAELEKKIDEVENEISISPEVKKYVARFGTFSDSRPKNVEILLRDIMGRKEGEQKNGKYSTDESVLAQINTDITKLILKVRKLKKTKSTYVDNLDNRLADCVVYADGKAHTVFNSTKTDTRRFSSNSPNLQNIQIRSPDGKQVRRLYRPKDKNLVILKIDYGQLEYRGFGIEAKDQSIIDSLLTEYDVHMAWAEKIVKVYPKTCIARYGSLDAKAMKSFRGDVKSELVFPAFYGAETPSISKALDMPERTLRNLFEEFWSMFADVRRWQKRVWQFYDEHHYVQTLSGFRRHGPMNRNMQVNTPIQGVCSDFVVDSMNRLREKGIAEQDHYLIPNVNIHDDLTFVLPYDKLDYYAPIITGEMLYPAFDFINVPLMVEVSYGRNWLDMQEIGKFVSQV